MATLSSGNAQGFGLYRKSDNSCRRRSNYLVNSGTACYEDNGYDDADAIAIVAMIQHNIDQGQTALHNVSMGYGRSTGEQPVSQEKHDAVLSAPQHFWSDEIEVMIQKEKKAKALKVNVARTEPKILSTKEIAKLTPYVRPPKRYTHAEDVIEVEFYCDIIESVDNVKINRNAASVGAMAKWIREDEHINYRFARAITCEQVREILRGFTS